jgi:23S rRNA (guanosine2251-2'-O)-methyltransferase
VARQRGSRGGRPRQGQGANGPRRKDAGGGRRNAQPERVGSAGEGRRTSGPGGERVEGRHAVRELLLAGTRRTREVVLAAGLDSAPIIEDIIELADEHRVPVREVGKGAFDALSDTESAQGVLAEADALPTIDVEELLDDTDTPFLVMVDGVTDPHNLGAIFRSADAAGAHGIVLPRHRSARITATVTKTAAGAVEHVPIATVAGVPAAITSLKDRDVWVVGLDEAGPRSIFNLDLADQPLCLVLGAEGPGLSRLTRERCDALVSIPMQGTVASLNVSAAATVALFEVTRRRLG